MHRPDHSREEIDRVVLPGFELHALAALGDALDGFDFAKLSARECDRRGARPRAQAQLPFADTRCRLMARI